MRNETSDRSTRRTRKVRFDFVREKEKKKKEKKKKNDKIKETC